MNKLWALLKITILNEFSINKFKDKKIQGKIKDIFMVLLIALSLLIFFISSLFGSIAISDYLKTNGTVDLILLSGFITTFIVIFFFTMIKAQGVLFSEKEFEKLIFFPIKTSYILISKLCNLLIIGYFISLLTYVPQIIGYGIVERRTIIFYIYSGLLFLFLPFIPLVLSSAFAFIIKYMFKNFKRKNLIINFSTVVLSLVIMIISFNSQSFINGFMKNKDKFANIIENKNNIFIFIINITKSNNPIYIIIYILVSILIMNLFIKLFINLYEKINSLLSEGSNSSNKNRIVIEKNSVLKALIKKELAMYFSIPTYVTNTIIGPAIILLGSLATLVFEKEKILKVLEINAPEEFTLILVIGFLIGTISLSCTTNSSISIEGKNLWILKSLPIKVMDIFKGKIILNLILVLPVTIIASIIFKFTLGYSYLELFYVVILTTIYAIIISIIGIIANLLFPRINWTSPAQVVKQSFSVILVMLASLVIIGIPVITVIKFNITAINTIILISTIYLSVVLIISLIALKYIGIKKYELIN